MHSYQVSTQTVMQQFCLSDNARISWYATPEGELTVLG